MQENVNLINAVTEQELPNLEISEAVAPNEIVDFLNKVQPGWASTDMPLGEIA